MRIGVYSYAVMIETLMERPSSMNELAEVTGLHYTTIKRYVAALRKRGIIHVTAWGLDHSGRHYSRKLLKLGRAPDAPRPARKTLSQISKDYRANKQKRADPKKPRTQWVGGNPYVRA